MKFELTLCTQVDTSYTELSNHRRRPSIDTSTLDSSQARTFFTNTVADPDIEGADFGDRIDVVHSRASYATYSVKETLEAKIARLAREVDEARRELELEKRPAESRVGKQKQSKQQQDGEVLEGLEAVLKQLQVSTSSAASTVDQKLFSHLTVVDTESKTGTSKKDDDKIPNYNAQIVQLASLEDRISKLEKIIGLAEADSFKASYRPVLETLQDLRQRLQLLTSTPAALDMAANNLRNLITSIEKLKSGKATRQPSTTSPSSSGTAPDHPSTSQSELPSVIDANGLPVSQAAKIDQLYSKLPVVEKFHILLPKILERLKSLRGIHADAESTNLSVRDMDSVILGLKTDIKNWQSALVSVEEKLTKFETMSSENKKEVKEWIDDLRSRA